MPKTADGGWDLDDRTPYEKMLDKKLPAKAPASPAPSKDRKPRR